MGLSNFEIDQAVQDKVGNISYICLPCQFLTKEFVSKVKELKQIIENPSNT